MAGICSLEDNRKIALELQELYKHLETNPQLKPVVGKFLETSNKILGNRGLKNLIIDSNSEYNPDIMDVVGREETDSLPAGVMKITNVKSFPIVSAADNSMIPMLLTDQQKSEFRGKVDVQVGKGASVFADAHYQKILTQASNEVQSAINNLHSDGKSQDDLKRELIKRIKADALGNQQALETMNNRIEFLKKGYLNYEKPILMDTLDKVTDQLRDAGMATDKISELVKKMNFYIQTTPSAFTATQLFKDYQEILSDLPMAKNLKAVLDFFDVVRDEMSGEFKISFDTKPKPSEFDDQMYDMGEDMIDPSKDESYEDITITSPAVLNADGTIAQYGKAERTKGFPAKKETPIQANGPSGTVGESIVGAYNSENTLLKQALNDGSVLNYMWINKSFDGEKRSVAEHHRLKMLATMSNLPVTFTLKRGNVIGVGNESEPRIKDNNAVLRSNDFKDILYIEATVMENGKQKRFLYSIMPLDNTIANFRDHSLTGDDKLRMDKMTSVFNALRNSVPGGGEDPQTGIDITDILRKQNNKTVTKGRIITRQKVRGESVDGRIEDLIAKHQQPDHPNIKFHEEVFVLSKDTPDGKYKAGQAIMFASQDSKLDFSPIIDMLKKGNMKTIPSNVMVIPVDTRKWDMFEMLDFFTKHNLSSEDSAFLVGPRQTSRFDETMNRVKAHFSGEKDVIDLIDQIKNAKIEGKKLWGTKKGSVVANSKELLTYLNTLSNDPATSEALKHLWDLMQNKTGVFDVNDKGKQATWGYTAGIMGSVPMVLNSKQSKGSVGIDISSAETVKAKGLSAFDFLTTTIDFIGSPSMIINRNAFVEIVNKVNQESKKQFEQGRKADLSDKTTKLVLSVISESYYNIQDTIENQVTSVQNYSDRLSSMLKNDLQNIQDPDVRKVFEEKTRNKLKEVSDTLIKLTESMNNKMSGKQLDTQIQTELNTAEKNVLEHLKQFHLLGEAFPDQAGLMDYITKVKNGTKTNADIDTEEKLLDHYGLPFEDLMYDLQNIRKKVC